MELVRCKMLHKRFDRRHRLCENYQRVFQIEFVKMEADYGGFYDGKDIVGSQKKDI